MNTSLKRWVKGQNPSASHLNESVDLLRSIAPITGSNGIDVVAGVNGTAISLNNNVVFTDVRNGVIVDAGLEGPDDHFDERYFVKPTIADITDRRGRVKFTPYLPAKPDGSKTQEPFPFTVINKIEEKAHTHFLRTDGTREVTIFGFWDRTRKKKFWIMWEQPENLFGIITDGGPEGEIDFTNHQYWAKVGYIANNGGDPTDVNDYQILQIPLDPDGPGGIAGPNPTYAGKYGDFIVVVENLPEKIAETHSLATDGTIIVPLFYQLDNTADTPHLRYWTMFGGAAGSFPVKIAAVNGADATTATTLATYTFDIETISGTSLGTDMTPLKKRPLGKITVPAVGDYGLGFNDGSTFYLWDSGECKTFGACAT